MALANIKQGIYYYVSILSILYSLLYSDMILISCIRIFSILYSILYFVGRWLRELGAIDFAGGTVIHISSGFSALVASFLVGKRKDYNPNQPVAPNNVPFVMLGAGLLW